MAVEGTEEEKQMPDQTMDMKLTLDQVRQLEEVEDNLLIMCQGPV